VNWHLLVVDLQKAFAGHILDWSRVVDRSAVMIQAARKLEIPVSATEQNPEKLGPTVPEIAGCLENVPLFTKKVFSSLGVPELRERIAREAPVNLIIVGIETHVCILQTALSALGMPERVTPCIPVDAVGSRRAVDRDTALSRLQGAGAVLTTVESVIFEILGEAGTDRFRSILPLVK